ncbi:MAG: hypothetical protein WKG07_32495 [Hymenobacter sp.]
MVLTPQPLTADPGRTADRPDSPASAQRTAALALPFFEDFTLPCDGTPSPARWQGPTPYLPRRHAA